MKSCCAVLACLLALTTAQQCTEDFGSFLNCLNRDLTNTVKAKVLEQELDDGFVNATRVCFQFTGIPESTSWTGPARCFFQVANQNVDIYGSSGPLKDCGVCQGAAKLLRTKYFSSTAEQKSCLRQKLKDAIVDEVGPCIKTELQQLDFKVPSIPDFNAKDDEFLDAIESTIKHRVNTWNRLDDCLGKNNAAGLVSSKCMSRRENSFYKKHCDLASSCKSSSVSAQCSSKFEQVKTATCTCLNKKREEWRQKLSQLVSDLKRATSSNQCEGTVDQNLGPWVTKAQDAIRQCYNDKNLNIPELIKNLCKQAVPLDDRKREILETGSRFIRYFLDALSDRLMRFCQGCSK